jgi:hypothetical protein
MRRIIPLAYLGILALAPAAWSGGILDKLNQAAQKLKPAAQPTPQSQPASPQTGAGSPSAGGATNLHGLDDYNGCMAQTSGAQEKLDAQVLQRKLDHSPDLAPDASKKIQEDIAWLNAKAAGQQIPAPDPKNSQRYLTEMSDEEQQEVSGAYGGFANEVHEKCEAQYGGMSQFSDPAGRRPAPIDTHVPLPDLLHAAAPVHVATAREQRSACMEATKGVRWQIMAEHMEKKLASMSNLSAQDRKAWEEDIAVVRAAQASGTNAMPRSPDPQNPMRFMTRLDTNEQVAMSQEQMPRMQQIMAGCQDGGATQTAEASARAQELAAMHEQRRAQRNAPPADADAANAAAQAWMDAHPFTPRKYAAGSATQADYIEKSGTQACFDRSKGFRAKEVGDKLSTKRNSITADQRQQLEGWITAWRAAEQAGLDEPTPPAGSDAQGYLRLLTNSDQQEINMATSAVHNKVRTECNAMDHMELHRQ